jgi:hypothetical protein
VARYIPKGVARYIPKGVARYIPKLLYETLNHNNAAATIL